MIFAGELHTENWIHVAISWQPTGFNPNTHLWINGGLTAYHGYHETANSVAPGTVLGDNGFVVIGQSLGYYKSSMTDFEKVCP